MGFSTVTLANATTSPPYRKRLNGEVEPSSHFPFLRTSPARLAKYRRGWRGRVGQGQQTGLGDKWVRGDELDGW